MKIVFCILFMPFVISNQGFNDRRIILIHAEASQQKEMNQQLEKFLSKKLELKHRKIAIFTFCNQDLNSMFNTSSDSEEFINDFLSNHNFEDENFSIRLFGLDSGEKSKFHKLINPELIYKQIDQMPMRRAEINRENKN